MSATFASAWLFIPNLLIPYDFNLQSHPWVQFTSAQACFELNHSQEPRQEQVSSVNLIRLTTFVAPVLPQLPQQGYFISGGNLVQWGLGSKGRTVHLLQKGNLVTTLFYQQAWSSSLKEQGQVLFCNDRNHPVLAELWELMLRRWINLLDRVVGSCQGLVQGSGRAGHACGSCTMHLACGMTEEHLVKIRVQAGLPEWLFGINKCCVSPHSDCLTSCCWEGNVSMLCMILVCRGLAECSGTSSPKHIWCACLTYSVAVPGLCMLLNNFPIVSLVTLLSVFGLAFVLCPSPFKACLMENAQPFPESNLKEPFLSILLWITHFLGNSMCPVLPVEKTYFYDFKKKSLRKYCKML